MSFVRRAVVYVLGVISGLALVLALVGFVTAFLVSFIKDAQELETVDFGDILGDDDD